MNICLTTDKDFISQGSNDFYLMDLSNQQIKSRNLTGQIMSPNSKGILTLLPVLVRLKMSALEEACEFGVIAEQTGSVLVF